ncbi:DUF6455 family protein [Mesobacterium pallidum]|uniref:DUF6455 family protein n=1 Tax=Mesobacterium pallidum TaxID=2872037 RepID=UPI001EE1CB3E|nr:DUF6455 family protein [Mesobacterium pallidum]
MSDRIGDIRDHYWLVQRMAKAVGVDLAEAWDKAAIEAEDWAGMVHQCQQCDWSQGCQRWMDQRALDQEPAPPPEGCENRHVFDQLRAMQKNG